MTPDTEYGLVFPAAADGSRRTSTLGRAVVADALRAVDAAGALAAEQEAAWRAGYLPHFRRLVISGLASPDAARTIARGGLDSLHHRMRVAGADGDRSLGEWTRDASDVPDTVTITGSRDPDVELSLPYEGRRLRGDEILDRLESWVHAGVLEPSAADAVRAVVANPEWLRLDGITVAVLGAGSEMGPLQALLRWGARVAAVDLPRPDVQKPLLRRAEEGAGTMLLPTRSIAGGDPGTGAGIDLIAAAPAAAQWLTELPGRLVVGNYGYADGATNVRLAMAVDLLTQRVREARPDTALAFLATPTDVFAVPPEAVAHSVASYEGRSRRVKALSRPLRAVSGGRLLQRAYLPGADPGVIDSLVPQQGPNYALAKRLQRWRAVEARSAGATVSMNVAPPTRTRSVVKNRALAAAYAGAHRFGVEVFEPATSNVLMAALLVHDLHTDGGPRHEHPWQDEAYEAVHGGLWRAAYGPRSALGLAALLGVGSARS